MKKNRISYQETNRFNQLALDYLNQNDKLSDLISDFPNLKNFKNQIERKSKDSIDRNLLYDVLKSQNSNLILSELSLSNLEDIRDKKTFTISTGHQLCLFTGPLYFIYKIISAINLVKQLKANYDNYNFVPIFWLASEDHDFNEINSINLFNKKITWQKNQDGPVGRMKLEGLDDVLNQLEDLISKDEKSIELLDFFRKSYLENNNLADATRYLVNHIFGEYGILIIDGDDRRLKNKFIDVIDEDINKNSFYKIINSTNKKLLQEYHTQAHVRPINFFRLLNDKRDRITNNISRDEIIKSPESFSPNVLLRPLYQEMILPNLAYIGGGSEIAYWLQTYDVFKTFSTSFPILLMRNSVLILNSKQSSKIESLNLTVNDFFNDTDSINKKFIENADDNIDLSNDKINFDKVFQSIENKISDESLLSSLKALNKKTSNSLKEYEKRVIRHLKSKRENEILKIKKIKDVLFPNNQLQERHNNFISMYLNYGDNFIKNLVSALDPLDPNFVILEIESL